MCTALISGVYGSEKPLRQIFGSYFAKFIRNVFLVDMAIHDYIFSERMTDDICKHAEKQVLALAQIWFDIGIPKEQRMARAGVVKLHISNLLDEMIAEEKELQCRLVDNIKKFRYDVDLYCNDLNLPEFETREGATIVQQEKELRLRADELAKVRHERIKKQKKLLDDEKHLLYILGLTSGVLGASPSSSSLSSSVSLLSITQLEQLEKDVQKLEEERSKRLEEFRVLRVEVCRLLEDLERGPDNTLSHDVICDDESEFILSDHNIAQLKDYSLALCRERTDNISRADTLREEIQVKWEVLKTDDTTRRAFLAKYFGYKPSTLQALKEELSRLEAQQSESCSKALLEAQAKLTLLWDRCLMSDGHRKSLNHLLKVNANISEVQQEIESAQAFYQLNKSVLDKVEKHRELYKQLLDLESKVENRENLLTPISSSKLIKEKTKKKLVKELSAAEQDAISAVEKWSSIRKEPLILGGLSYREYVSQMWRKRHWAERGAVEEIEATKPVPPRTETRSLLRRKTIKTSGAPVVTSGLTTPSSQTSVASSVSGSVYKRRFACITPTNIAAKLRKLDDGGSATPICSSAGGGGGLSSTSSSTARRRQTVMTRLMESPGRLRIDTKGFVMPREPVVITRVKPLQEVPPTVTRTPLSTVKPFTSSSSSRAAAAATRSSTSNTVTPGNAASSIVVDRMKTGVNPGSLFHVATSPQVIRNPYTLSGNLSHLTVIKPSRPMYQSSVRPAPTSSRAETVLVRPTAGFTSGAGPVQPGAGLIGSGVTEVKAELNVTVVCSTESCLDDQSPKTSTPTGADDVAAIGHYTDFMRGLTQSGKRNICSSAAILPKPKSVFF